MGDYNRKFKTNRVNRTITFVAHLYFNAGSRNRETDDTPRYYLKPVKLKTVERIAFTDEAKQKGYGEYGYHYFGGGGEEHFTDKEALALFESIKSTYPFGFDAYDTASVKRYNQDVKFNTAYQSYYASYWKSHLSEVKRVTHDDFGVPEQPHNFIEFPWFKVHVTSKHNTGTVPAAAEGLHENSATTYNVSENYYVPPKDISCSPKVINISLPPTGIGQTPTFEFAVDGDEGGISMLNASGTEYVFRFVDPWPKESGNASQGFSGDYLPHDFRFSETRDGTHSQYFDALGNLYRSGVEYTSGTQGFIEHETVTHRVTTTGAPGSPYYGVGFYIDGAWKPSLTFKRGSEYIFDQSDISNSGHPLHITTHSTGGDKGSGIYCEVQAFLGNADVGTSRLSESKTIFRVPWDAPSNLYYQCKNHQGMGNGININQPTLASSILAEQYIPGTGVRVKIPVEVESISLYHYSSGTIDMGSMVSVRDWCVHKCEEDMWRNTGGISGSASTY